ncbi:MAG: Xaa-Pro peptidase family protein [Gemmatimonadetes bacterium]|nr:Xaa-Pro peptidase family protein [Gemmatimonadota bacterium]
MASLLALLTFVPSAAAPLRAQTPEGDPTADTPTTPEERFFDWTRLPFPPAEYEARRGALLEALSGEVGVFLVTSAHGLSHGDTFRQSEDFLYLTGLELPGSALVLDLSRGAPTLFVPDRDFRFESLSRPNDFPGRRLGLDPELPTRSGLSDIRPMTDLRTALVDWEERGVTVHINAGRRGEIRHVVTSLIPDWDPALLSLYHLQNTYPRLRLRNAYDAVARVRMVKTPREVEAMRRSARATQGAIRAAARRVRDGVTERQLEATFEGACKENGAQRIAFASIIKSGPNSLWPWRVLASHYDRRNRAMHDGEMVIFDVGCEVDYYVSDVGRTFPVSGRFTPTQRRILRMEVAVADAIIEAVRPGITFAELQEIADAAIPEEHRRFMQTGLFFGHHIGLSTGDPNLPDLPLAPGMVFTVEPWYYNHEAHISVFTEDEILVTEDGAELLTDALPRTAEGLERVMLRDGS